LTPNPNKCIILAKHREKEQMQTRQAFSAVTEQIEERTTVATTGLKDCAGVTTSAIAKKKP